MICPECGHELRDNARFCDSCGFELGDDTGFVDDAGFVNDTGFDNDSHGDTGTSSDTQGDACANVGINAGPSVDANTSVLSSLPAINPGDFAYSEAMRLNDLPSYSQGGYQSPIAASETQPIPISGNDGYLSPSETLTMPKVESETPTSRSYRADDLEEAPRQTRSKKKILIIVAALVVVIAAAVFGLYQAEIIGGLKVPDVAGMSQDDAIKALKEKGFLCRVDQVKSDDTEGLVLLTDPAAGDRAREGSEILIHVATPRCVPDVVGLTLEEAEKLFEKEGLVAIEYKKIKTDDEDQIILTISEEVGKKVTANTPITVEVSQPYIVPDVVGKTADAAIALLKEEGLSYTISYKNSDSEPEDKVLSVSPDEGEKVKSTTKVTLTVAVKRSTQLIKAAKEYLASGKTFTMGGTNYLIVSEGTFTYDGNDVVSFSVSAKPYAVVLGQKAYLDQRTVTGKLYFDSETNVKSIS